jgi:hypothetical protein
MHLANEVAAVWESPASVSAVTLVGRPQARAVSCGDDLEWPPDLPPPDWQGPLSGGWVGRTLRDGWPTDASSSSSSRRTPLPPKSTACRRWPPPAFPYPAVLGVAGGALVLQYVSGKTDWPALGRAVARMHRSTGPAYGRHRDDHAGRLHQDNGWLDSWRTFTPSDASVLTRTIPVSRPSCGDRLHRACDGPLPRLLPATPPASLTHGDLWAGNIVDGRWLIDPEVSYADRELDLAYMQGSESLPAPFWASYEDACYAHRRRALQLHHLGLQVRHFGLDRYRRRIEAVLDHYGW